MGKYSKADITIIDAFRRFPIIVHKNFTIFHAGGKGEDFFDIDRITCNLNYQNAIIDQICNCVKDLEHNGLNYNKLAFIEKENGPVGMIVLASSLSQILRKDIIILRLWKKLLFDHLKIKGWINHRYDCPIKENDNVLLIDDVITTGKTQKRAIDLIKSFKANIPAIVCYFLRQSEAEKNLTLDDEARKIAHIWSYSEISLLGLIQPQIENLQNEDFIQSFSKDILDNENSELTEGVQYQIDNIIIQILKKNNISINTENFSKQFLRNLFFHGIIYNNQQLI